MLINFIAKQLQSARYKILDDGTYFGEIPGLQGIWSHAENLEDCRTELQEVIEDWLLLKVRHGETIPGLEMVGARTGSDGSLDNRESYA